VLRPLKVVLTNLDGHHYEELDALNNPEDPSTRHAEDPIRNTLYIEQDDSWRIRPPKFFA